MAETLLLALLVFAVYFAAMFHLSKLVVPHLGRLRAADALPSDLQKTAEELSKQHKEDEAFVEAVLEALKGRYHTRRAKMFLYPKRFLFTKIQDVPPNQSYPCTILNYVFVTMLVKSGRFKPEDIATKYTWVNGVIHQYLTLRMQDGSELDADPWGYGVGKCRLGEYATGFL